MTAVAAPLFVGKCCHVLCHARRSNKYGNDDDEEGSEKTKQTDSILVSQHARPTRRALFCVALIHILLVVFGFFFLERISRRFAFDGTNSLFLCQFRCDAARLNQCSEACRLYGCERQQCCRSAKTLLHTYAKRMHTFASRTHSIVPRHRVSPSL